MHMLTLLTTEALDNNSTAECRIVATEITFLDNEICMYVFLDTGRGVRSGRSKAWAENYIVQ